ncbi:HD domain-containing protein [Desulfobacterales bacterium HSG16]|nr:HD domain-containing protein [Desulfobacterales bacterium HSG16]
MNQNTNSGMLNQIRAKLEHYETRSLSPLATASIRGMRRNFEISDKSGYRQSFSTDADRIMHSHAYARYIDKTQVFSLTANDHVTHRVLHVQLVSKIGRTIGRYLGLNEDLIEAIALGHDIGHPPFGHDGEKYLSNLCARHGIGHFRHCIQSIRFLDSIEQKGKGWNLCLQTLDGILCHDGEIHNRTITPQYDKTFFDLEKKTQLKKKFPDTPLIPSTLEGCVVRFADTISYIGRDIEDAIRLDMITRSDIPKDIAACIGNTNGTIVYNLVTDIIENSIEKPYISYSRKISDALKELKNFNMKHIYLNPKAKKHADTIELMYTHLFETCLENILKKKLDSLIFSHFLENMSDNYIHSNSPAEIVMDFIAGMTDHYFIRQCPDSLIQKMGIKE